MQDSNQDQTSQPQDAGKKEKTNPKLNPVHNNLETNKSQQPDKNEQPDKNQQPANKSADQPANQAANPGQ